MNNKIENLERYSVQEIKELTEQYLELDKRGLLDTLKKIKYNIQEVGLGISAEEIINNL